MRLTPTERLSVSVVGDQLAHLQEQKEAPPPVLMHAQLKRIIMKCRKNSKHSTAKQRATNLANFFRRTVLALPELSGLQPPSQMAGAARALTAMKRGPLPQSFHYPDCHGGRAAEWSAAHAHARFRMRPHLYGGGACCEAAERVR
jgi:hypothetical protein